MTNLSRGRKRVLSFTILHPFVIALLPGLLAIRAPGAVAPGGGGPTDNIVRLTKIPGTPAPALPPPVPKTPVDRGPTNGPAPGPAALSVPSQLKREIVLTGTGAKAVWGRTKAWFPADLGSGEPIRFVAADGKALSFHPAFLAIENRTNSQLIVLGEFTNASVGTVVGPNTVVWSNVCGKAGPDIAIEIRYLPNGIQHNALCSEKVQIPADWDEKDVALEVWSAWYDCPANSTLSRTVNLRPGIGTNSSVPADDQTISFGAAKITAGGKAFGIPVTGTNSMAGVLPVAKNWIEVASAGPKRAPIHYLVEAVDYSAAKASIEALPTGKKQASLDVPGARMKRADVLRRYASLSSTNSGFAAVDAGGASSSPGQAKRGPSKQSVSAFGMKVSAARSQSQSLLTSAATPGKPAFVLDFSLLTSVPLPPGAVSWWPAGGNSLDALTNRNHGSNYNGVLYTAGEAGQGFELPIPGEDEPAAHVRVTNATSLQITNALTLEAWINPAAQDYPSYRGILSTWDYLDRHQRGFDFSLDPDGHVYIVVSSNGQDSGASYVLTTNAVACGEWTHVAAVYDGSSLRVYMNGSLAVTPGAYTNGIFRSTNDLGIGGYLGGAPPGVIGSSTFYGGIDEPTIYSRALAESEIQAIYEAGPAGKINPNCIAPPPNAVAWWPGDQHPYDIAGFNAGVMMNGATFASAVVGPGFNFDGSGAHVRVPDSPDFHQTTAMTIEAWVYPTDTDDFHDIASKWECTSPAAGQKSYDFSLATGGQAYLLVSSDGFDSGDAYVISSNSVPANAWTHIAGVYDGASLKIYLNGLLDGELPYTNGIYPGTNDLGIGGVCGGGAQGAVISQFAGVIDEVTMYCRALDDTEISSVYSAGCAGKCKVDPYAGFPPRIVTQPASVVALPGSTEMFRVAAAGQMPLAYQWSFNGTNRPGATSPILTLTNVQTNHDGWYSVVVTNLFGSIRSEPAALQLDSNSNGVPDWIEVQSGGNPNNSNSLGNVSTPGYLLFIAEPKAKSQIP